ncbi:MAG: nucleotidyltransferase domain-containing protein [Bacteroidales bacterium]|nr:nucleotidyltransferase domain-containing protein [Bacteroidales bacterium]MBQ9397446.1 nucleotidyltransferase domain-containing protein [Bacteroidales bacterium]
MSNSRNETIINRLHQIEAEQGVVVLFAAEIGSRAWGLDSPDSDCDVHFVYVHLESWYLSLAPGRDVIEIKGEQDGKLEMVGWDLKKAMALMAKGNATVAEWLDSPLYYVKDSDYFGEFYKLRGKGFNRIATMAHYAGIAHKNDLRLLERKGYKLKHFLYYLRGILAAQYAFEYNSYPPVNWNALVDATVTEAPIREAITELVRQKREGRENDDAPVPEAVVSFAHERLSIVDRVLGEIADEDRPHINPKPFEDFFIRTVLDSSIYREFHYINEYHKIHSEICGAGIAEMGRKPYTYEEAINQVLEQHRQKAAFLFVGIQGSGKTTFYKERFRHLGYRYISMDEIRNRNKEWALFEEAVTAGENIVIDNTNVTRAERARYLDLLKQKGYHRIFCYFFQSRVRDCIERNHLRGTTVPDKAIAATSNRLELPSKSEGFTDMIYVRVEPPHFETLPYYE